MVSCLSGTAAGQLEGREWQYRLELCDETGMQLKGAFLIPATERGIQKRRSSHAGRR